MTFPELSPHAWIFLAVGAALVGFAKTAVGGVGALAVVAFAAVLPAKESTGALLPLLCVGDLIAVRVYHRHADWRVLLTLLPGVVPGMALGAWFLSVADDTLTRRVIGATLVAMVAMQVWMRRTRVRPADLEQPRPQARSVDVSAEPAQLTPRPGTHSGDAFPHTDDVAHPGEPATTDAVGSDRSRPRRRPSWSLSSPSGRSLVGIAAGFATMTANAAGAVTTLYMILAGLPMRTFLGTAAWFYLIVNAAKAPVSAGLGLISPATLGLTAVLVPALIAGATAGVWTINRIDQDRFEQAVLLSTAIAAVALLL